ncbi:MAG: bifunctional aspartate kinase/diaminopimelate decarboxylase [Woeseia sp.]
MQKSNVPEAHFTDVALLGASDAVRSSDWIVMKFGGTSVSDAANWRTIAGLVRNRLAEGLKPLVVHSALRGVSNALSAALDAASCAQSGSSADSQDDGIAAIREQHFMLAAELGLDAAALLDPFLQELQQLLAGVRLVHETSVRVRARVLALGELMATTLGAAYLQASGIECQWRDARKLLVSDDHPQHSPAQNYLSATCSYAADADLRNSLAISGKVTLTQGFIAGNASGETVLLGREGSDTSAAYLAARLQARRLEIWTDVPGMYTADPKLVPSARLLVELHFDEAQELASMGSKVLHPRCLSPLREQGIPLFIRCTTAPAISGTVISSVTREVEPQVKGISTRSGTVLISMEGSAMWHEVGFLAEAFAAFRKHGVSVDLVSTSQTNVTVSIDTVDEMFSGPVRSALMLDLEGLCRVRLIPDCAVVSLVGRKIRTILPRLAPALAVFEEEKIHLVSQASNDLNFSFVIEQAQVSRLVPKLHSSMISQASGLSTFGPTWEETFREHRAPVCREDAWWHRKRGQLLKIAQHEASAYVYDIETVRGAACALLGMKSLDRVLYAVKANSNAEILQSLASLGVDFDCVSPGEVDHLLESAPGLDKKRILLTLNFAPREEYEWALKNGISLTLDNLYPLREWPGIFRGKEIFIRLDPGQGRGHHEHVKTAGVHSKFGIPRFELEELVALVEKTGADVVGIHAHSGSGILDPEAWRTVAAELIKVARHFPRVRVLDLGGGLGVPERPGDREFNLAELDEILAEIKKAWPEYELWLEPGRFLVAQAGVLLTHVTQVKGKGAMRYVGVGTGMNSLIRPALYGAYHEIVNLTRLDEPATETVTVVGPICETGDRLGSDRLLPECTENDVIIVANTGAYGYVMGSNYNMRGIAREVVI